MESPNTRKKTSVWLRRKRRLYRARRAASAALHAPKRTTANPVRGKAQIDPAKLEGAAGSEPTVAAKGSKATLETDPQTPNPSPHPDTDVQPVTPENTQSDEEYLSNWSTPSPSTIAHGLAEAHGQAEAASWGHVFRTSNGSPINYWPYQDIYIKREAALARRKALRAREVTEPMRYSGLGFSSRET
ncbi:hypothetical protein BD410DRAFT_830752 [Rickenella mellea]|uniref:Uncharacterized protein n=1 Tax=Rickenella mellea TaxID=50990 RepID=A0A4Y7PUG9_9AGAM|nr:hypothetical protein BD410DRAFT_830752 [Rickenella mellea]